MGLKELVTIGNSKQPPRILLYGVQGIGKSTFGAALPKPIFILTEDGLRGKAFENTARFPVCKTFEDVKRYISMLIIEEHEHKSVVLDSLGWLQKLIFEEVAEIKNKDDVADVGYQAGYKIALSKFLAVLELLAELHEKKNMLICLLGHSDVVKYNPPDGDSYDRYGLNLHKLIAPVVQQWSDIVLFVNYKVRTKRVDEGFGNSKAKAIGTDEPERIMYTQERPAFHAKNRYDLPAELDFSWEALKENLFKKGA